MLKSARSQPVSCCIHFDPVSPILVTVFDSEFVLNLPQQWNERRKRSSSMTQTMLNHRTELTERQMILGDQEIGIVSETSLAIRFV